MRVEAELNRRPAGSPLNEGNSVDLGSAGSYQLVNKQTPGPKAQLKANGIRDRWLDGHSHRLVVPGYVPYTHHG